MSRSRSKVDVAMPNNGMHKVMKQNWQSNDVNGITYHVYRLNKPILLNSTLTLNEILLKIKEDRKFNINKNFLATVVYQEIKEDSKFKMYKKFLTTLIDYANLFSIENNEKKKRIIEEYPFINAIYVALFKMSNDTFILFNSTIENIIEYLKIVLPPSLENMYIYRNLNNYSNDVIRDATKKMFHKMVEFNDATAKNIVHKYYSEVNRINNVGNLNNFEEPPIFNGQPHGLETKPIPFPPSGGSRRRLSTYKKTKKAKKHLKKSR